IFNTSQGGAGSSTARQDICLSKEKDQKHLQVKGFGDKKDEADISAGEIVVFFNCTREMATDGSDFLFSNPFVAEGQFALLTSA
ncbi:MAG TPA: hypothetical protein PKZ03_10365, partial [Methanothrix sp.]|nr:hypothetical protein [Methanothrix sp.]